MILTQEIIDRVHQLELRTRRTVTTLLSGNYRSAFRGSGMQFKEFRRYEPGDDIRHMSWQVTARTGKATIKTFEEDRELNVFILVDVSGSSLFGNTQKRKIDMYAELVSLIGLAAVKSKDNVGMLFFNDKPAYYLPPKDSQNHVLSGITNLLQQPLNNSTSDLRPSLTHLSNALKNRALIIIISDFLVPQFDMELKMLTGRHEVVLLHCFDDAERGSLPKGIFEVCDPESGQFYAIDSHSAQLRNVLGEYYVSQQNYLEQLSHCANADYLSLSVEDDYLQRLVHFFRRRGPSQL